MARKLTALPPNIGQQRHTGKALATVKEPCKPKPKSNGSVT